MDTGRKCNTRALTTSFMTMKQDAQRVKHAHVGVFFELQG